MADRFKTSIEYPNRLLPKVCVFNLWSLFWLLCKNRKVAERSYPQGMYDGMNTFYSRIDSKFKFWISRKVDYFDKNSMKKADKNSGPKLVIIATKMCKAVCNV